MPILTDCGKLEQVEIWNKWKFVSQRLILPWRRRNGKLEQVEICQPKADPPLEENKWKFGTSGNRRVEITQFSIII